MEAWAVVEFGKPLQKIQEPLPEPTGAEVLIQVTHCGVCHSDLHFWEGFYDLGNGKRFNISDRTTLPRAVGHEIVGKVAKLGPDAKGVAVGDSRIVYPWIGCGNCSRCAQGDDNLCAQQASLGVAKHGGFASHVVVPHARYLVEYGKVDPAVACTFACSGITVLSAIRKIMPLEPEDPIVLVGAGGLGLSAISMLRALGHRSIISVDIQEKNREAALKAGATAAVDGLVEDAPAQISAKAGRPILGVIDFVNNSKTAATALGLLARGGKMVQVGVMGGELPLSLVGLIFKGATIYGNLTGNLGHLRDVAGFAQEDKLQAIPISTTPWEEANSALMDLRDSKVTGRRVLVKN